MSIRPESLQVLRHLAGKPGHDEVKADFRQLLVGEFDVDLGDVHYEQRVEVKSRIDALIGRTVFEAKRDLATELSDVERKMPDYLANREEETGEPFVGIASDGRKWIVYALDAGKLVRLEETILDPEKPENFLAWLDGALALKISLPPDPTTVQIELGGDSVAFRAAEKALREAWARLGPRPAEALKRQVWAQLLKFVYGRDVENDALWLQHTYLVIVAKCIAFAVLGLHEDDPAKLLSGDALASAGIFGAVESDFFDWIVADPEGARLVKRIMAHVRRFRLSEVATDVLKTLYESLIDRGQRHGLGEYYTPDWLAAKMTRRVLDRPLEQKVLDPACGSGAFLFHAIRLLIEEAREADFEVKRVAGEAVENIAGIDIHPVAVIVARVTYLLALAPVLAERRTGLYIPVYLGDALQLQVSRHFHEQTLTILVPPDENGKTAQFDFPELLCREPEIFDGTIAAMRNASQRGLSRAALEKRVQEIIRRFYENLGQRIAHPIVRTFGQDERNAVSDAGAAYLVYDQLRREGRDSIWSYVARNLSRPLFYSFGGGRANVLIGNPPWVAFRHMTDELQKRFRELAKGASVYVGGKFATQNDLCALFTARCASLYLKGSGRIAFVLPLAALTRGQFERLRSGAYQSGPIHWDEAWTMDDSVQPLFPVPACALFGRRRATAKAMPDTVRAYSSALPMRDCPEALLDSLVASGKFKVTENAPKPTEAVFSGGSAYRAAFRQGATLVPRMLCFVERKALGRIGPNPATPLVMSRRSPQEKRPWRDLPGIENPVEAEFLRPTLLGESILPYRVFRPFEAVIPVTENGDVLDAAAASERSYDHLWGWMNKAETLWSAHAESGDMTLIGRWNYHNELGAQFPIPKIRIAYAKAGTQPAATLVRDSSAVIDHMLYWRPCDDVLEGRYLLSILNSETARSRAEAFQARGQWGARHFDKVMFNLPIPRFDAKLALHRELAASAEEAEGVAAAVPLPEGVKFQRARALVRAALADAGLAARIDALVARLLDGG
ncbi:MAG: N-6 DNA methylase [Roseiarcus sp.]